MTNEQKDKILDTIEFISNYNNGGLDKNLLAKLIKYQDSVISSNDIYTITQLMSQVVREKSNGAAILDTVYVTSAIYNKLINDLKNTGCTEKSIVVVNRAKVKEMAIEANYDVIGICKSKFEYVPPEMLIVLGKVNNGLS